MSGRCEDPRHHEIWRFVRSQLPPPPARVVELGCGLDGGLVPCLRRSGYRAVGVDPEAPPGRAYHRSTFEAFRPAAPVDAFVTSAALHHVGDLGHLLDQVEAMLVPGAVVVVVEWAWELFDELTAQWCFARLGPDGPTPNWLQALREGWAASGLAWRGYEEQWALQARCHRGEEMLTELDRHFERRVLERSPYFYYDLEATSEDAERAAVQAGLLNATGILYAGTKSGLPSSPARRDAAAGRPAGESVAGAPHPTGDRRVAGASHPTGDRSVAGAPHPTGDTLAGASELAAASP